MHFTNTFKNELITFFKKRQTAGNACGHSILLNINTIGGNIQNMKPVQICTGFIFCSFPTVIYTLNILCICNARRLDMTETLFNKP